MGFSIQNIVLWRAKRPACCVSVTKLGKDSICMSHEPVKGCRGHIGSTSMSVSSAEACQKSLYAVYEKSQSAVQATTARRAS
jgi:hypothetical protein